MPDLASQSFTRILIVKPSSLGDIIHALPVLHAMRERYPDAKIDWLIAAPFAPLLCDHSDINELVIFDRQRFGRTGRSFAATSAFVSFLRSLRARKYDLVVDLQGLFRSGLMTWATGAPVRIGFRSAREGAWVFYTDRVRLDNPDEHAIDRNLRIGAALGLDVATPDVGLSISDSWRTQAAEILRQGGVEDDGPVVAVVPGTRWETKQWLPERFAKTIDAVQVARPVRCVLLGSKAEADLCRQIATGCETSVLNLAGSTDLGQLAAIIDRSDLVLCHDSAAMHIAVARDRPLLCLVGPTNPRRTGPYRRLDDVVRVDLDCAPCYFRRLAQCPHDHRCMTDLSVDRVVAAMDVVLAASNH